MGVEYMVVHGFKISLNQLIDNSINKEKRLKEHKALHLTAIGCLSPAIRAHTDTQYWIGLD